MNDIIVIISVLAIITSPIYAMFFKLNEKIVKIGCTVTELKTKMEVFEKNENRQKF